MMTQAETLRRARMVFRDLGRADAAADLRHRATPDLVRFLERFAAQHAPGANARSLVPAINQYPKAYRRAAREPHLSGFTIAADHGIVCTTCNRPVTGEAFTDGTTGDFIAQHVASIGHVARAERAA